METVRSSNSSINDLIISYLTNTIGSEEEIILLEWINQDDANRDYFNRMHDLWIISERPPSDRGFNSELSYNKLFNKLNIKQAAKNQEKKKIRQTFRWYHLAAAGILLFVLGSIITLLLSKENRGPFISGITEVTIPYGSKSRIVLNDGSVIWLNAGTSLTYNSDFGLGTRTVILSGEAFFEVKSDKNNPFIVRTNRMTVKATGTRFNVKSYPDEDSEHAILVEGKINIEVKNNDKKSEQYNLRPNEKLIVTDKSSELLPEDLSEKRPERKADLRPYNIEYASNIRTELYTSWKDDIWLIEGETLETLVPKLERKYNLKFRFANIELKKYRFSGTIENETIDQILEAISLTAPVRYHIIRDSVILNIDKDKIDQYMLITTKNR